VSAPPDASVRRAVRELLAGRSAHVDLEAATADLPAELRGVRPEGLPHAVWELVEHLRIAQRDLVDYTLSGEAASPPWPEGYWPAPRAQVDDATWEASLAGLRTGLAEMDGWLRDPAFDLTAELAHSDELPGGGRRTPLRQVLVAADHLGYHVGQIVTARRALGAW
jgi:hypothetical protein